MTVLSFLQSRGTLNYFVKKHVSLNIFIHIVEPMKLIQFARICENIQKLALEKKSILQFKNALVVVPLPILATL